MGKLTQTINLKKVKPEERKAIEDFRKVANARKYKGIELNLSQRADAKGLKDYEQINRDFVRAQLEVEVLETSVTELTEQLNRVEKEIKDKGTVTVKGVTTKLEYTDEANAGLSKRRAELSAQLSAVKKKYDREKTRRDKASMDKKRFDENTADSIFKYNGDKNVKLNMTEEHYISYLNSLRANDIKNNNDKYDAISELYDNGIARMAADFDELMPQIIGKEQMYYSEEAQLPPIFRIAINGKSPAEYWYKKAGQEKKFKVNGKEADKPEDIVMNYTSTIKAAIMMALIEGDAKITYVPLGRENWGDAINRYKADDAKDISVDLSDYAVIKNAWMEQNKKNLNASKGETPAKVNVAKEQKRVQKLIDKNYKEIEKAYKDKNGKAGYSPLERATAQSKRIVKEYKKARAEIIFGKYDDKDEQLIFDTRSSIRYNTRIGDLGNRQLNGYLDAVSPFSAGNMGEHLAAEISKTYEQAGEGEKAGKIAEYLKFIEADAVSEANKNLRNLDTYNTIKTIRERYHKILSGNNFHYTQLAKTSQIVRENLERNPDSKAIAAIVVPASRSILKFYREISEQYTELTGIFPHTKSIDGESFDMPSIDEKIFTDEIKRKRYVDLHDKINKSISSLRGYGDRFFLMAENGISMKEFESMFAQMMDEANIGGLKADMDEMSLLLGEALLEKNVTEKADYFENKTVEAGYVNRYAGAMGKLDCISNMAGKLGDMIPDETDNELEAKTREWYGMDFKGEDQAKLKEAKDILKGLGDPNRHAYYNINKSDIMSDIVRDDLKNKVNDYIDAIALDFLRELSKARKAGNEAKITELMQKATITNQQEEADRLRIQQEAEYRKQRDNTIKDDMQKDTGFTYQNKAPLSFLRDVERSIWYTVSAGVNAEELGAEFTNVNNIEGFKNAAKEFNTRINAEIDTALTDLQKAEDDAEYTRLSIEKNKGDIEFGNIELRELNDKGETLDNEVLMDEALVVEYEKNKSQYDKTSAEFQAKFEELSKGKSVAIAKDEDGESYNQARQNAKSIIDGAQNGRKLGDILKDKAINIDGAIKPVDKSENNAKRYDDMSIEEFLTEYQRVRPEYGNAKDKFVEAHPALQKRYEEIFGLYDRADNDLKIIDVLEDKKPIDALAAEYGGMITDLKKSIDGKKEEIAYIESRCTKLAEESVKLQAENEELVNKLAEQKADAAQKKDKFEHLKDTKGRVADIEMALEFTIETQKDNMYRSYNKYLESKSRYKDEAERQAALEKSEMEHMQKNSDAVAKEQKEQLSKLSIPNEKLVGYLNELIDLRSQVRTAAGLKAVRKDAEETFENARAIIEKNKELKALFAGNKAVPKNGNRDWKHDRVAAIKEGKFFANNAVQKLLVSATKGSLFSDANQVTPIHDEVMVPIEKYVKAFQKLDNIVQRFESRDVMPENVAKEYDKLSKMTFEDKATGKKRNLLDDVKEAAKPNGMRPLYTEFDLKQVEAVYRSIRHGELNYMIETLLKPFDKSKQLVDKAVEIPKEDTKEAAKKEVSKEKVDLKDIAEDKKVAVLGKESKTAQKEKVKTV